MIKKYQRKITKQLVFGKTLGKKSKNIQQLARPRLKITKKLEIGPVVVVITNQTFSCPEQLQKSRCPLVCLSVCHHTFVTKYSIQLSEDDICGKSYIKRKVRNVAFSELSQMKISHKKVHHINHMGVVGPQNYLTSELLSNNTQLSI